MAFPEFMFRPGNKIPASQQNIMFYSHRHDFTVE